MCARGSATGPRGRAAAGPRGPTRVPTKERSRRPNRPTALQRSTTGPPRPRSSHHRTPADRAPATNRTPADRAPASTRPRRVHVRPSRHVPAHMAPPWAQVRSLTSGSAPSLQPWERSPIRYGRRCTQRLDTATHPAARHGHTPSGSTRPHTQRFDTATHPARRRRRRDMRAARSSAKAVSVTWRPRRGVARCRRGHRPRRCSPGA